MSAKNFVRLLFSLFLIVSISLGNFNIVLADDGIPPTPTPETTEPTETDPPAEETLAVDEQVPAEEEAVESNPLSEIPENTEVVVLDENGDPLPLATEEALEIILETDPMWCPAGALPGTSSCTTNYATIAQLINNMISNTNAYDQAGIIYFTAIPGASFSLTTSSLGTSDFSQLKDNNLTLQGGWNGVNGAGATFTGQSNFGSNSLTIGTSSNPWIGNITLTNFTFSGVSSTNAVTVYTTNGDITLNNVDVAQQSGGNYTANLVSSSGDITVQSGSTFDGNNSGNNQNRGFNADTDTGSITVTGTSGSPVTFTDANGCGALFGFCILPTLVNYNGATLSAPTVSLTNVSANNNDLNGIQINNASSVTLNNVNANNNGTDLILSPNSGDVGSGVMVNGTGATSVNITGGTFNNNERYGVEVNNGAITVSSAPSCSNNDLGCLKDSIPPVLNLPGNIIAEAASASGAPVSYTASATDAIDGTMAVVCSPVSGSTFAIGITTVNCSATDSNGNTSNGNFTVTVRDTTAPVMTLPANITIEATNSLGALVSYSASASDLVDGARPINCAPASGNTFAIGITTVNCSAADSRGNTATGSFTITVQDTTAPVIAQPANKYIRTINPGGKANVGYDLPATSDAVDGAGVATCAPPPGSYFKVGKTTVTCTAVDSHGNVATPVMFVITVEYVELEGNNTFIPLTGGATIELDCNTKVELLGIQITFINLCDHEATLNGVEANNLPGQLPNGYSFVMGLDVVVLKDGQAVSPIPAGTGIEMDFPVDGEKDQFAVLVWDGGKWVEISQEINEADLSQALNNDTANELYKIISSETGIYKTLTAENTGTFVLVKK